MAPRRPPVLHFLDDGKGISQFADEFLVVCPQCDGCARVALLPPSEGLRHGKVRLLCPACGGCKEVAGTTVGAAPGLDWYFHRSLWLSTNCAGGRLWAFNARHLSWLESYIQAALRARRRDPQWGWSNQSAANRLPEWMTSAKNRQAILRGIARLKRKAQALGCKSCD